MDPKFQRIQLTDLESDYDFISIPSTIRSNGSKKFQGKGIIIGVPKGIIKPRTSKVMLLVN